MNLPTVYTCHKIPSDFLEIALNLGMMRCVAKNTKAEKNSLLDFSKVEFYWTFSVVKDDP